MTIKTRLTSLPDDLPGGGVYAELVQGKLEVEVILLLPVVVASLIYQVTPQQGLGGVTDPALHLVHLVIQQVIKTKINTK